MTAAPTTGSTVGSTPEPTPAPPAGSRAPHAGSTGTRGTVHRVATLTLLLTRPSRQGAAGIALPVTAFAVTTLLLAAVTGGTLMFLTDPRTGEMSLLYAMLSILALVLLMVPLATLGAAAARLTSRRRNDRLSTLRLLGATSGEVSAITVAEASLTALTGALVGAALYGAALPLLGLLPFFGGPVGAAALWTGWLPLLGLVLAATAVATVSAATSLRRVRLTPLGVRRRTDAAPRRVRMLIAGAVGLVLVVVAAAQSGAMTDALGQVAGVAVLLAFFAGAMALVNLIGTPIIAARGRSMARRATTAARLIAGRELAAHAPSAWRRVSAISMISFIAVIGGSGIALADMAGPSDDTWLLADIRTGVLVTLAAGFALLACSIGVTHAASVLEDRELIVGLDRLGMAPHELARARRLAVMTPLRWAAGGGAAVGAALALPVVGVSLVVAPLSVAVVAVTFAAGFGVVLLALAASTPLISAIRRG